MTDKTKRVWILGSGFSVPLGGPTLASLLSLESFANLKAITHSNPASENVTGTAALRARLLYHYGRKWAEGCGEYEPLVTQQKMRHGEALWTDAEAYLARLERACTTRRDSRLATIANAFGNVIELEHVYAAALRAVAVECSIFLDAADTDSETWLPYRQWAWNLTSRDVVLTFNYDRIPELLKLAPVLPNQVIRTAVPDGGGLRLELRVPRPLVIKLHGSLTWRRRYVDETVEYSVDLDHNVQTCPVDEIAIATPGNAKSGRTRELAHLWRLAIDEVASAHEVIFVGYRFPPSDTEALTTLLRAIRVAAKQNGAGCTIVLGPQRNDHVTRLEGLLHHATGEQPRTQPLYCQDYLTLLDVLAG